MFIILALRFVRFCAAEFTTAINDRYRMVGLITHHWPLVSFGDSKAKLSQAKLSVLHPIPYEVMLFFLLSVLGNQS